MENGAFAPLHAFLLSADFFFQNKHFQNILLGIANSFRNNIRVSNSLDPDHGQCFDGHDLVTNCLQRL